MNIDNPYFEGMVNQICPPELQLNKANTTDTEASFLDLFLLKFMINAMTLILIFWMVTYVPRCASYGVYISQLIRFARVCNHIADFNERNKYWKEGFFLFSSEKLHVTDVKVIT